MNSDLLLLDKIKYIEGYCPDLFSWGELANIINIRPLMTSKRVGYVEVGSMMKIVIHHL